MRARGIPRLLGVILLVIASGCGDPPGEAPFIVVYTSVDDVFARPIAERIAEEIGVEVRLVPDTEETKSTGLLNRLLAEKERPVADVFWSGDPVRAATLARRGVAASYRSPAAEGLPQRYSSPSGLWTGFSVRARVLIWNRNLVAAADAPSGVFDLLDARFREQACIANPLFGTTSMHAAALFQALGRERAQAFFDGFRVNGGKVLSSNGEVKRRVASGEFAVGITDTDDANVARLEGKPIGIVFPDQGGIGTLIIPNCAVLIAGAPHEAAAQRFIDSLLESETEAELARSEAAQLPVRPGVVSPAAFPALASIEAMVVDYDVLAALLDDLSTGFLRQWVEAGE